MGAWIEAGAVYVSRESGQPVAAVAVLWDPDIWGDDLPEAGYIHLPMVGAATPSGASWRPDARSRRGHDQPAGADPGKVQSQAARTPMADLTRVNVAWTWSRARIAPVARTSSICGGSSSRAV